MVLDVGAASLSRLFAVLLGVLSLVAPVGADEAALETFFADLHTLRADFEQWSSTPGAQTARGRLYISRPGKFRWDYLEPYHQQIVSDGRRLWIYDEDLEQVTLRPLGASLGNTPALLLSEARPLAQSFSIRDRGREQGLHWLELRPLDAEQASFKWIRLGLADNGLRQMILRDKLDQTTRLRFGRLEKNPPLDSGLFDFRVPEGVDVFEVTE